MVQPNQVYLFTAYLQNLFKLYALETGRMEAVKKLSFIPHVSFERCIVFKDEDHLLSVDICLDGYRFEAGTNYSEFFVNANSIHEPNLLIENMIKFLLTLPKKPVRKLEEVSA